MKTLKKVKLVTVPEVTKEIPSKTVINPLSLDFGREDLNKLVDKLNEVISKLNML